jgi:hypothetical protein
MGALTNTVKRNVNTVQHGEGRVQVNKCIGLKNVLEKAIYGKERVVKKV